MLRESLNWGGGGNVLLSVAASCDSGRAVEEGARVSVSGENTKSAASMSGSLLWCLSTGLLNTESVSDNPDLWLDSLPNTDLLQREEVGCSRRTMVETSLGEVVDSQLWESDREFARPLRRLCSRLRNVCGVVRLSSSTRTPSVKLSARSLTTSPSEEAGSLVSVGWISSDLLWVTVGWLLFPK